MKKVRTGIFLSALWMFLSMMPIEVCAAEAADADVPAAEEAQEDSGESSLAESVPEAEVVQETDQKGNSVNEARNGILQVNLVYVDGDNKEHVVRGGSGFLVGNEEGADYVITSNANVTVTEEFRNSVGKEYKVPKSERKNMQFLVQVVVKRDVVVSASVVTSSEQVNFAVLKLGQTIYDRTPLLIEKDPDRTNEMDQVYTLGFPEQIQSQQDVSYYTYEDVSVMNGIVSKKVTMDGTLYIQHSAAVTAGNAGGPILNQYGQVIGINQIILEDGYHYSVHISEVTSVLDALGIPYTEVVPEEEAPEPVDLTPLQNAIDRAGEKDLQGYTEESIELYNQTLEQARAVLAGENPTEEDVTRGLTLVSDAGGYLVIKSNNYLFLIIGGIAAAFLILIIVLAVLLLKKNSGKTE